MYSLHDAMGQACKDTSAMIAKMSFASDVGLCERKRQAWAALLKQQPKESLVKRTEAEKKAKRAEKNKIYQELKKKNNGKACVYTKDMKIERVSACQELACSKEDIEFWKTQKGAKAAKRPAKRAKKATATKGKKSKPTTSLVTRSKAKKCEVEPDA
eukprot:jgi/Mesvir1/21658/Mv04079-RA.1